MGSLSKWPCSTPVRKLAGCCVTHSNVTLITELALHSSFESEVPSKTIPLEPRPFIPLKSQHIFGSYKSTLFVLVFP